MVAKIYNYFKKFNYKTIVMAASLRKIGQIAALCGCDKLTMPPALIDELMENKGDFPPALTQKGAEESSEDKIQDITEPEFRWAVNMDEMAVDKIADGIRLFAAGKEFLNFLDAEKLAKIVEAAF